tara:strand:+ start:280 stop:615 length:336 start_codon:yes stop_codon:yes gene_type:complete
MPEFKDNKGFRMKGFTPFTRNQNRAWGIAGGKQTGVSRKFKEQDESQKSKFRKKIESGKGLASKLFGGKREGDVYKPGLADRRIFGGVGHRNLKKGDTAANTKKAHSRLNW